MSKFQQYLKESFEIEDKKDFNKTLSNICKNYVAKSKWNDAAGMFAYANALKFLLQNFEKKFFDKESKVDFEDQESLLSYCRKHSQK